MRAVITVLGKDNVGILAKVSNVCADAGANIIEVTQSVLQEMFAMIMLLKSEILKSLILNFQINLLPSAITLDLRFMLCMKSIFNTMYHV